MQQQQKNKHSQRLSSTTSNFEPAKQSFVIELLNEDGKSRTQKEMVKLLLLPAALWLLLVVNQYRCDSPVVVGNFR
jgi:hypothetical protein